MNRQAGAQHWTRRLPERVRRGTAASGAKLAPNEIEEITFLFTQCGSSQSWLARKFNVSRITIWRHLKAQGLV